MLDVIKELILDFQEVTLETGIPRHMKIEPIRAKASICIGVRRCGKSTYLFQVIDRLCREGIPRQNILYLNFFDDRLHGLKHHGPGIITEAYYSLFPEKKNAEPVYCFFDEIQVVDGWESFVDRLLRTENCEVYLTGSSAQMLSRDMATQMRGRALAWELFPFSFREFLDFKKIRVAGSLSTKQRLFVQKAFDDYWVTGGFPETAGLDSPLRRKIHQEYFRALLFRDMVERHDISHPRAVIDLALRLIDNTGSLYTINSLTGYLKSLGHKVPKTSVADYLNWFEDAYFLFSVHIFDASLARRKTNPKKVFCIDHSLVNSVSSGILINSGHLLENLVFTALRRRTNLIYYYRSQNNLEIDFLVQDEDRSCSLIQVCQSLADPQTRKRELSSLNEAMLELKIRQGTIITRSEEESVDTKNGRINIIPAWRYLLDTD